MFKEYTQPLMIFFGSLLLLKFFEVVIIAKLKSLAKKTKGDIDDLFVSVLESIGWLWYVLVSLFITLKFSNIFLNILDYTYKALIIISIYYAVKILQIITDYFLNKFSKNLVLGKFLKWIYYLIGFVMVLNTLGYDISALLAGLGITGIAIAFAMQNILSDIFASFSIFFDKPFKEGDYIVVGQDSGTVKKIGIKSTRIIALSGQEIVISNKELTEARVHNYKKMKERRVDFLISVVYETSKEKLQQIPDIIKDIIERVDNTKFDRVSFKELADSGLIYEVIYHVNDRDYLKYANARHEINLKLIDEFNKHGIEFAYPTQKVFIQN